MKYIEELNPGDLFLCDGKRYILTSDYRDNQETIKKLAINIENGYPRWLESNKIAESLDLYFRDNDGNIIALKEIKNEYSEKTPRIH